MIELQEFGNLFKRITEGQLNTAMLAMKNGEAPETALAQISLGDILGTMWCVCQPNIECRDFDLTDKVKSMPGAGDVTEAWMFVAWDVDTKHLEVLYLDGRGGPGPGTINSFNGQLHDLIRSILVDEIGLDEDNVTEKLNEDDITASGSVLDQAFQRTVERELSPEEEAEVAKYREEIDARIDSLFKHGEGG